MFEHRSVRHFPRSSLAYEMTFAGCIAGNHLHRRRCHPSSSSYLSHAHTHRQAKWSSVRYCCIMQQKTANQGASVIRKLHLPLLSRNKMLCQLLLCAIGEKHDETKKRDTLPTTYRRGPAWSVANSLRCCASIAALRAGLERPEQAGTQWTTGKLRGD